MMLLNVALTAGRESGQCTDSYRIPDASKYFPRPWGYLHRLRLGILMGVRAILLVVLNLNVSCPTASCQPQMRNYMNVGTGRRLMPPICLSLMCSPAEILQGSRSVLHSARRGVRRRRPFWHFGTWNIRSLLDSKGSVDTVCQGFDCHQVSKD